MVKKPKGHRVQPNQARSDLNFFKEANFLESIFSSEIIRGRILPNNEATKNSEQGDVRASFFLLLKNDFVGGLTVLIIK